MTQFARFGIALLASLAVANYGGGSSPTAPSPAASTQASAPAPAASPTPTPTQTPAPAPTTANVNGTWLNGGSPFMTLTQNGATVSGTLAPLSVDLGGITSVFSGTVTGSTSGANVNLSLLNVITARAGTETLVCRGTDTWAGTQSGNTLTGTFTPSPSGYLCDGGIPLPVPAFRGGPMVFTKQ